MASIAYITDKNMIEYHRVNGNHTINFWKPSTTRKIQDFHVGDFLFFLAKGTEKGIRREKGIIGYGKLQKSYTLSFSQMWNRYEYQNGYASKELLEEAICKVTKNHKIPDYLNCLILEDLVFFQAPVYLSEIGVEISNSIESYTYIDRSDMMNTSKILEVAQSVGVDLWSSMFRQDDHNFLLDAKISFINNICEKNICDIYSTHDIRNLYKFSTSVMNHDEHYQFLSNSKIEFMHIQDDKIIVYLPCIVNSNEFIKKFQCLLGHYMVYQAYLSTSDYQSDITLCLLFNQPLQEEYQAMLKQLHIEYEERLVED